MRDLNCGVENLSTTTTATAVSSNIVYAELGIRGAQKPRSSIVAPEICARFSCCWATPSVESTVRYLGIEIDDAVAITEKIDV